MTERPDLWRAVRWPVLVLAVAAVAVIVASALDRTDAREWALTIGAPALTILLPLGALWLVLALVPHLVRSRR